MPNSLYPAFIELEYSTPYGEHVMTIPIRAVPDFESDPALTICENWDATTSVVSTTVANLCAQFANFYTDDSQFNLYSIWTMADSEAIPEFAETYRFTTPIQGSSASTTWKKAAQNTFTFRTADGGISKVTLLDSLSFNLWDKQTDPTGSTDVLAVIDAWTDTNAFFAGRDNARPSAFLQLTKTLNEKLRRAYRMT
jgi:hypothetical protein